MKKLPLLVNGLFLLLCACGQAHADFLYIRVGNGTPNVYTVNGADVDVTIPVYAYDSETSTAINTQFYSLAFQINGDGKGVPSFTIFPSGFGSTNPPLGISTVENFTDNALFGRDNGTFSADPVDVDSGNIPGHDFVVGNTGGVATVGGSNSPTKLFDFMFTIKANAQAGDYSLSFVPGAVDNAGFSANSFDGVSATTIMAIDNSNQLFNTFKIITAVPEPSSLALVGLVSVGMCLARRRRASV